MRKQGGFTLIELVAVIVILGALAAVAVPRFVNLQDDARQAGADGVAGGLAAGSATNFAADLAGKASEDIVDCASTPLGLNSGTMPDGYSIDTAANAGPGAGNGTTGDAFTCTVQNDADSTITSDFTAIYVENP